MYFICHVTQEDNSVEMSCVFMGESSSLHVTTMRRLVTTGILIVKRKNAPSKTFCKYVPILKNRVDWITTRQKRSHKHENGTFSEQVFRN